MVNIFIPHNETLWHLIAAPQEDGAWRFRIIDGRDVSNVGYAVRVHWGEIVGWYDGCNECGRSEDGGMMTCTLQACVAYPSDPLYRLFAQGRPAMSLRGDSLILTVPGHRAVLDRAAPGRR